MESKKRRDKIRLEFVQPKESTKKERERVMEAVLRRNTIEKEGNTTSILGKGMV